MGYDLDLENPKTLSEKLQWRKLHVRNPLMELTADKVQVRGYITEKVGDQYLMPVLGIYDSVSEIPWEDLPECILKVNHGSGRYAIYRGEKRPIKKLKKYMKEKYGSKKGEWVYGGLKRKIVIEPLISTPTDHRFFCFHGKPEIVQVQWGEWGEGERREAVYDLEWDLLPESFHWQKAEHDKPKSMKEMISVAEKLSVDFEFARVDLYEIDGAVKVAEITHFPMSGFFKCSYDFDLWLGGKL